jgi:hypothetical protein
VVVCIDVDVVDIVVVRWEVWGLVEDRLLG